MSPLFSFSTPLWDSSQWNKPGFLGVSGGVLFTAAWPFKDHPSRQAWLSLVAGVVAEVVTFLVHFKKCFY